MSKHRMNFEFMEDFPGEKESTAEELTSEIYKEEVAITPPEEETKPFAEEQTLDVPVVVCNCKNVNVRAEPSMKAKILSTVPEGFKCTLLEDNQSSDFFKVRDNKTGEVGFIKKEYIKRC